MEREQDERALLALRGGLRGRFRRSFDGMENAFEVLQDRLDHTLTPTQRGELTPILQELQAQLLCLRRLGDQASDAATAALLHGICTPRPIDLPGQLREICAIIKEEAARYDLPFEMELLTDGAEILPTAGDASLLNGLLTNLISNTLAAAPAAHITLVCSPGKFIYRDDGPGLPPDAKALLTDGAWSDRLLHAGGLGLPLIAVYAKAMGWTTAAGDGPGTELVFTLPAAPDLDGLTLESAAEHYAEQQSRRLVIRRELAVAAQTISEQ